MILSPQIAIVYMDSIYIESMIHAISICVLIILNMGVSIKCGYESRMEMDASNLLQVILSSSSCAGSAQL
jgi:hypothetical protein